MAHQTLVSIIIPTYNRAHIIGETLDSVLAQTYTHWECIVVDDGSSDSTKTVVGNYVKNDARFQFYHRPYNKPKGANACRNYGLEVSNGNLVNWLDSDDLIGECHLENHLKYHTFHKSIDVSVSQATTFEVEKHNCLGMWSRTYIEDGNLIDDMVSLKISWPTPGAVWNRLNLLEKPFNETLGSSQEWTFHIEQAIRGIDYKIIPEITVYVRRHENRTGKDVSPSKFKSTFLSRFIILKKLKKHQLLTFENETFLLMRMFQALKSASMYRYDRVLMFQIMLLFKLLLICKRKFQVLKILFFSVPVLRITGKGERLFTIR